MFNLPPFSLILNTEIVKSRGQVCFPKIKIIVRFNINILVFLPSPYECCLLAHLYILELAVVPVLVVHSDGI